MKKIIAMLVVLFVCGTTVIAGEMKKEGSLMLGYGAPGGDLGDIVDGGIAFGFGYEGYKINDTLSIGGEFFYTSGEGSFTTAIDYSISTWGLLPYIKASKEINIGDNKGDLYGLFGMGIYGVTWDVEFPTVPSLNTSASESEFGVNIGGGIMFPIGEAMKIGADIRYHVVASNLKYLVPSAKFTYSF